jgi:hypothetical protein
MLSRETDLLKSITAGIFIREDEDNKRAGALPKNR